MKTSQIAIIIIVAVLGASLMGASALAFLATKATPTTTSTYGNYPNGMMSGYQTYPSTTNNPQTTTPPTTNPTPTQTTTTELTPNDAATKAQNYLNQTGYSNLEVKTVQEYTNTYYVQIFEKDTGTGAFELAVDKYTGAVVPMQGPTMMWDTKYGVVGANGMMGYSATGYSGYGGMMGSGGLMNWLRGTPTAAMPISLTQAQTNAQQYLDTNYPGTTVGAATTYYGYYTMQVMDSNGNVVGVVGVNGATGQVMDYTWCGNFMRQIILG
jgi:hypothetical protein